MRLRLDLQFVWQQSEMCFVVSHRWNFFLIEDDNLLRVQSKELVAFKELLGLGVSVFRSHNDKGNGLAFAKLGFKGVDILAVILKEALLSQEFLGNRHFDPLVA